MFLRSYWIFVLYRFKMNFNCALPDRGQIYFAITSIAMSKFFCCLTVLLRLIPANSFSYELKNTFFRLSFWLSHLKTLNNKFVINTETKYSWLKIEVAPCNRPMLICREPGRKLTPPRYRKNRSNFCFFPIWNRNKDKLRKNSLNKDKS